MALRRWGVEKKVGFINRTDKAEGLTLEMSALESLRWPNYLMDAVDKTKRLFEFSFLFSSEARSNLARLGHGIQLFQYIFLVKLTKVPSELSPKRSFKKVIIPWT